VADGRSDKWITNLQCGDDRHPPVSPAFFGVSGIAQMLFLSEIIP
jgi:hypothetical protein